MKRGENIFKALVGILPIFSVCESVKLVEFCRFYPFLSVKMFNLDGVLDDLGECGFWQNP